MRAHVIPILATASALLSAGLRLVVLPPPRLCAPPPVSFGELPGYTSEHEDANSRRIACLPSDTCVSLRRYLDADERPYVVTAVLGGSTRASIHRPEICLPIQGFIPVSERTITVNGVDWRHLSLKSDGRRHEFAYTFFDQAGFQSSSHAHCVARDVFDRAVLRRIDRWVMLTVFAADSDEQRLNAFLATANDLIPSASE